MAAQNSQNESSLPETMESSNLSSTDTTETLKSPGQVTTDNSTITSPTVTDPAKTTSWADEVSSPVQEAAPPEEIKQTDGASEPLGGNDIVENSKFDVHVKLSDLQANPNDPLYSIKSFEDLGLSENILKGIYQMRFTKPSKIQERALPLLLANPPTNMIGQSQSGTGKTAAFVLNILSRLDMSTPEMQNAPQALCLAPTRELARQIMGVIQLMGSFVEGLGVVPAIPLDSMSRGKELRGQIVVGTPGTVQDLIKKRLLRTEHLKVLVLDEADTMLDMQGLGDQCIRVKNMLPKNVQKVLFSATFPEHVTSYADRFAPNANQITLQHEELTVEGIRQLYFECAGEEGKIETLLKLYGLMTVGSSIIFVNTRATALKVEARMTAEGHKIAQLTGAFDGHHRDAIIDEFRSGRAKVLIATNVLARGIDVQTVTLVVNFDLPKDKAGAPDYETYLHRIGRTGRFGRVGVSISLVHDAPSYDMLQEIGRYFAVPLSAVKSDDWDAVEKTVKQVIKSSRAGANFQAN